jgi:hypothetical protein
LSSVLPKKKRRAVPAWLIGPGARHQSSGHAERTSGGVGIVRPHRAPDRHLRVPGDRCHHCLGEHGASLRFSTQRAGLARSGNSPAEALPSSFGLKRVSSTSQIARVPELDATDVVHHIPPGIFPPGTPRLPTFHRLEDPNYYPDHAAGQQEPARDKQTMRHYRLWVTPGR